MTKIIDDWLTNPPTQAVMKMLTDVGHQAFFVGGCVRNALIGDPVHDIDIATDALPATVMALATAAGFHAVPTGIDHGTVTVVSGSVPHEITTFRDDVETDGRRAVVAFSTNISDDAHRRDFTMNALYADADGNVQDPLGGLVDLNARYVRFVDDPNDRITEDYLRTLRFFRFHAWYGDPSIGMDADALAAIATNLDGLDTLSRERVGAEFKKLLAAADPAPSVGAMTQAGVLTRLLPGTDNQLLAPLVHLDAGYGADPIRRLAALGGQDVADRLRLSRDEARQLKIMRDQIGGTDPVAVLTYYYGVKLATDLELLRAAVFERPVSENLQLELDRGVAATFPIRAADLMPELKGPALGARLKQLEARWIASDFQLSRAELLAG